MKQLLLLCCLVFSIPATAQLFVDSLNYSAEELVMDFFDGSCVDVLAAEHTGIIRQKTFFEGSQSGLGVQAGILLTTGEANIALGPNDTANAAAGYGINYPSDNSAFSQFVEGATGGTVSFDWSLLYIKLVPHTDSIGFKYVFASEEYCEFVGTQYNDVFGFLISGPGITGVQNIALVPNTSLPVAINNVNHLSNSAFYRNNTADTTNASNILCFQPLSTDPMHQWVQYDGTTTVLTASATVMPDSVYEVWIGISDIGDGVWDSGIFLSIESLCGDSMLSPVAGFQAAVNGNTVTFDNSTKYATAWHWDFGDGETSTARFPSHTYANLDQSYLVELVGTNYCCADTFKTLVGANTPVQEVAQPACRVFPTRFQEQLTIELPVQVSEGQLLLSDVAGHVVLRQDLSGYNTVSTAQLPAGSYFVTITAANGWRWVYRVFK